MKIKEVEQRTGIAAKNIRFYEEMGLIVPRRNPDNSYREYGNADVQQLMLVKMLRKLDLPLPIIRQVLEGRIPLAEAAAQQAEQLEAQKRELEAAQRVCRELARDDSGVLEDFDVEEALRRMETLEKQGERFADILHDFKLVAQMVERTRFRFWPEELITTPREFTEALFAYANEEKISIVITRESMYPRFVWEGVEYEAARITGRFGSEIYCEALEPELLIPKGIRPRRVWWMEWAWRVGLPLVIFVLLFVLLAGPY